MPYNELEGCQTTSIFVPTFDLYLLEHICLYINIDRSLIEVDRTLYNRMISVLAQSIQHIVSQLHNLISEGIIQYLSLQGTVNVDNFVFSTRTKVHNPSNICNF